MYESQEAQTAAGRHLGFSQPPNWIWALRPVACLLFSFIKCEKPCARLTTKTFGKGTIDV